MGTLNRKKRILFCNEFSELNTGFAVIGKEIMTRLYATNKFDVAEIASYVEPNDPKLWTVPWETFPVMPDKRDQQANREYNSNPYNQFGRWKFEEACLKFKPDVICEIRDPWHAIEWQLHSPYWGMFKYMWMATIDGVPSKLEWLDYYKRTDCLLTYSNFAKSLIEQETNGQIKVFDVVSPGVNIDIFKPVEDKTKHRQKFGLPPDINIVLTVMRNQGRKLFPDLIESFAQFLKYCVKHNNENLANKTYLYLHTSFPDVGFDIGRYISQFGVGHKILMTRYCRNCGAYYPSFFSGELSACKRCGKPSAICPNTNHGLTREQLAEIYNLANAYVQMSVSEGFCCPLSEARACELPAFAVDYSAMQDHIALPGCEAIKVQRGFWENVTQTEQQRALPDNEDLVKKLYKFLNQPKEKQIEIGKIAREFAIKHHDFDRAAKIFERAIDSLDCPDWSDTWHMPHRKLPEITNVPKNMNNAQFIDWLVGFVIGRPDLLNSVYRDDLIKGLNCGFVTAKGVAGNKKPWNRDLAIKEFMAEADRIKKWEHLRVQAFLKTEPKKKWVVV